MAKRSAGRWDYGSSVRDVDAVNQQVGDVATQVGTSPANFSPGVFSMIRNVSESVIIPIAGIILTIIACYELIQMIIDHNTLPILKHGFSSSGFSRPCGSYADHQLLLISPWRCLMSART